MLNPIKTTDFDAIKLKVASPENILEWSNGEVVRPETINYRTQKPEKDGLFCERIFGPSKDWECYCGKYRKIRYKGIICDKCGVEVTRSIVRRERMGHIVLQTPVSHIWFLRGTSSKIGSMLDLSVNALEKVIYFANFIVTDVNEELKNETLAQIKEEHKNKKKSIESEFKNQVSIIQKNKDLSHDKKENEIKNLEKIKEEKLEDLSMVAESTQKELTSLKIMTILSETVYQELSQKFGHIFEAGIGAEAIKNLLEKIDILETIKILEEELLTAVESKKEKLMRRLKLFKSSSVNKVKPKWMVLTAIPIIPPDLRPMVALDGGRFATSDLNDLYRRVINRNNRLKQLIGLSAPEVITRNEKRMLQEAVDALIDNSARQSKTVVASTGQKRNLKSLADSLKGKQGRFRQNLLGKRIDYSGRSVIVVNPNLNLDQCGLPKIMALELFKPFIISRLIKDLVVHNVRSATRYIEAGDDKVWDLLEDIIKDAYVLLNRAPTLHRLGIQAFRPILIEGKAIQIHPLVCPAFNADFDGDQMAVHVPLTKEAKKEAKEIMLATNNLLKPATGDPIVTPGLDIIWGSYYMTTTKDKEELSQEKAKALKYFSSSEEVKLAQETNSIKLHDYIMVYLTDNKNLSEKSLVKTTAGRIIFNDLLPKKMRFINETINKEKLKNIVKQCFLEYGKDRTVKLLDESKTKGFEMITRSGLSWGMNDTPYSKEKDKLIQGASDDVEKIQEHFEEGLLTDSERYNKIIELWSSAKEKVTKVCKQELDRVKKNNPIYSMVESGTKGSWTQLTQIMGMKGLVTSPSGDIIELPVKGNFKQGFDVIEYFISTHGVRKGLSDTALRTANAGYLTRRLVDVSQDTVINADDCKDTKGFLVTKEESEDMNYDIIKRITGRYLAKDIKNKKNKVLVKAGVLISEDIAAKIQGEEIEEVIIRSILTCKINRGACVKCYGYDLGCNKPVKKGVGVGIIAAQSIGEPGTQLTMRTFHTGGVASSGDITQGLPRVDEIFEARNPKRKAIIAEADGKVKIETSQRVIESGGKKITINDPQSRILQISCQGTDYDSYSFKKNIRDVLLKKGTNSKSNNDSNDIDIDKITPKILVKNGDLISAKTPIFSISIPGKRIKTVKSLRGGEVIIKNDNVNDDNPAPTKIEIKVLDDQSKEYVIPKGIEILVNDKDAIKKGDQLTDGSINLQELYLLRGKLETQKYIIKEIQHVYSSQGQPLNDKHIEIIVDQMFSRYLVKNVGDTNLLPGEITEKSVFNAANDKVKKEKGKAALGELLLLGISKASLTTESFLSAASFQETNRVLIEAAINGKIDYLRGLKENVIIGRLIPVGTGYKS